LLGGVLAGVLFAVVFPSTNTVLRSTEYCTSCIAYRVTTETGLWFSGHRLLDLGKTEEIRETEVLRTVFGGRHEHRWSPNGSSGHFFGIRTFIASGAVDWNLVARDMECDASFRASVLGRVQSEALSHEELVAILELPQRPQAADVKDPVRRRLLEKGQELRRAYNGREDLSWAQALARTLPSACPGPKTR